mgnify:CR=1 FL=1
MIKHIKLFIILILINFSESMAKDNFFIVAKINDVIMTNYDIKKEASYLKFLNPNLSQLNEWESTLLDDSQIPESPCNMRIITTLVCMVSSYTTHKICDLVSSSRRNTDYDYEKKTIFNYNTQNNIKTYSIAQ